MAGSANSVAVAGTGNGATNNGAPAPGSQFGIPGYSTQPRFVPDNGNYQLGLVPAQGAQRNVPTTRLDQLDIVRGIKVYAEYNATWTEGMGKTLLVSPFFPANLVQAVQFKLQAAYSTFNLTGPLAAIHQAFRPMWGSRQLGPANPDTFAKLNGLVAPTFGTAFSAKFAIDVPFSIMLDRYFELDAAGNVMGIVGNAIVSPTYMAAQARSVTPTITVAPGITVLDLLGGGVTAAADDTTSTFTDASLSVTMQRDAWWTSKNAAGNPALYQWMYTNDYIQQPTNGQGQVGALIQNTGISVGQVLSLYGFVWDPDADSGNGAIVDMDSIESFEFVTGGTLQNWESTPAGVTDRMRSLYGSLPNLPDGVFIFDFAIEEDGVTLSNSNAINTYLVNGVQLNVKFKSGSAPGSKATLFLGVEALKMATS